MISTHAVRRLHVPRGVIHVMLLLMNAQSAASMAVGMAGGNRAYAAVYDSAAEVDQAAYESAAFWKEVAENIPGFNDAPELARYRGWVANLITKPQGELKTLDTGQEVLTQYVFPGLQSEEIGRTIEEREAARKSRDYARADQLRADLKAQGVEPCGKW